MPKSKISWEDRERVFLRLCQATNCLVGIYDRFLKPFGLTFASYTVLRVLEAELSTSLLMSQIKDQMITSCPDTTRLVDRLIKLGLVTRHTPEENRRTVVVCLTPCGTKLLREIRPKLAGCYQEQLGELSLDELERLMVLGDAILQAHRIYP